MEMETYVAVKVAMERQIEEYQEASKNCLENLDEKLFIYWTKEVETLRRGMIEIEELRKKGVI